MSIGQGNKAKGGVCNGALSSPKNKEASPFVTTPAKGARQTRSGKHGVTSRG